MIFKNKKFSYQNTKGTGCHTGSVYSHISCTSMCSSLHFKIIFHSNKKSNVDSSNRNSSHLLEITVRHLQSATSVK